MFNVVLTRTRPTDCIAIVIFLAVAPSALTYLQFHLFGHGAYWIRQTLSKPRRALTGVAHQRRAEQPGRVTANLSIPGFLQYLIMCHLGCARAWPLWNFTLSVETARNHTSFLWKPLKVICHGLSFLIDLHAAASLV